MKSIKTELEGVLIVETDHFADERGFFMETFHEKKYADIGIGVRFVQDNLSFSRKGVLRGLHYQHPFAQDKLVHVIEGTIFDVAVDIRFGSPTFGKWIGVILSGENKRQLFIPKGFAHGFCVTSPYAYVLYKCSDFYAPETEGGIFWNDPDIGVQWPVTDPVLSDKDAAYTCLKDIPADTLPVFCE